MKKSCNTVRGRKDSDKMEGSELVSAGSEYIPVAESRENFNETSCATEGEEFLG
jgi:hypothetical protein